MGDMRSEIKRHDLQGARGNSRSQGDRGGPGSGKLPPVKFFDGAGNILPDLLESQAESRAKSFVQEEKYFSKHQLRKFYEEVKKIERQMDAASDEETKFMEVYPLIRMLKAKVCYAKNRKSAKVPKRFVDWINECVNQISRDGGIKSFKAFLLHYEAVIGYFNGKNN